MEDRLCTICRQRRAEYGLVTSNRWGGPWVAFPNNSRCAGCVKLDNSYCKHIRMDSPEWEAALAQAAVDMLVEGP